MVLIIHYFPINVFLPLISGCDENRFYMYSKTWFSLTHTSALMGFMNSHETLFTNTILQQCCLLAFCMRVHRTRDTVVGRIYFVGINWTGWSGKKKKCWIKEVSYHWCQMDLRVHIWYSVTFLLTKNTPMDSILSNEILISIFAFKRME